MARYDPHGEGRWDKGTTIRRENRMDGSQTYSCQACPRQDLKLTANGRVKSHAANGKRANPETNPHCPGGSDWPKESTEHHVHRFGYGDDGTGHNGSFCTVDDCGMEEPADDRPTQDDIQNAEAVLRAPDAPDDVVSLAERFLQDAEDRGVRGGPRPSAVADSTAPAHGGPNPHRAPLPTGQPQRSDTATTGDGSCRTDQPTRQPSSAEGRTEGPTSDRSSVPGTAGSADTAGNGSTRATSSVPPKETSSMPTASKTGSAKTPNEATSFINQSGPGSNTVPRDRWGRYLLPHPEHGRVQPWTRTTTVSTSIADTFALSQWSQRMAVKGITLRPDLYALASGYDVSADKDDLNSVCEQAKNAAGDKVAANLGTAMHNFTAKIDRGEKVSIPPTMRPDVDAYIAAVRGYGFEIVPHLIERRVCLTAAAEDIAGTFDRVYRATRDVDLKMADKSVIHVRAGDHLIGDLKGLALTERIPTPEGWTTMGEVQPGDRVFDAYGKACTVTAKSQAKRIGTYTVRFDDGSSVVCDREHIWWTSTDAQLRQPTARGIGEVIRTLSNRRGQKQHRVPVAGSLDLPEADLPIDPYLLGCWLGDGARRGGTITKGADLFRILEGDGHALGVEQAEKGDCVTRTVLGLSRLLRDSGLIRNKHIPAVYLRASASQRTALLRGLMDTDGTWNTARQTAVFSTTDKGLAFQAEELLLSLGQRPNLGEFTARGFGKEVTAYAVSFTPVGIQPFRLPRKADQAAASLKPSLRSCRRVIVSVDPGPDVDTACIAVDSPTHTYLCGDRMVPTHNTGRDLAYGWGEIAIQEAIYSRSINQHGIWDADSQKWEPDPLARYAPPGSKVREDVGIVVHLPVQKAEGAPACVLYAVDLVQGWDAVQLCCQVRKWRKAKRIANALEVVEQPRPFPAPAGQPTDAGGRSGTCPDLFTPEQNARIDAAARPKNAAPGYDRPTAAQMSGHPSVAPEKAPPAPRPPTWEERADTVSTRAEASAIFQEMKANLSTIGRERMQAVTNRMSKRLESLVEQAG
jgi:hypothetical protein